MESCADLDNLTGLRFVDDAFPLIIAISDPVYGAEEVRAMAEGFERYFLRGERYAVLSVSPRNAPMPGQRERELIAKWANHPRVRDFSKRLCVGSATVAANPLARATLTVILAVFKPAAPHEVVSTPEKGLDYCLKRIQEEGLPLTKPLDLMRYEMRALLADAV